MEYINQNYVEPDFNDGRTLKEHYQDFDAYMDTRFIAVPFQHICNVPMAPGWDSHPKNPAVIRRNQLSQMSHATQPVQLIEPIEPDNGMQPVQSIERIEPDYSMQPVQITEPIDPDYTLESLPLFEDIDPDFAMQPLQYFASQPVHLNEHDYALKPSQFIEPDHAMQLAELDDKVQSVKSSHVIQPIQLVQPVEQIQPSHHTIEQKHPSQFEVKIGQQPLPKRLTYTAVNMMAIRSSQSQLLMVEEIYDFYYRMYPKYKDLDKKDDNKWKSSVRHSLSSSGKFIQIELPRDDKVKQKRFQYGINLDADKRKKEKKLKIEKPAIGIEF